MGGLSPTGIGLIVVLLVTLAALLAQLFYVLWRRRIFHRQNFSDETLNHYSSKELLYFFCWKNHSRIGPTSPAAPPFVSGAAPDASPDFGDLAKWRDMYGPSRVLFTINEDEREEYYLESSEKNSSETKKTKSRVSLEEHFEAAEVGTEPPGEAAEVVVVAEMETPFSTPCDSPLYYTPSPSPPREVQERRITGKVTYSPENDVSVDLEVGALESGGFSGQNERVEV